MTDQTTSPLIPDTAPDASIDTNEELYWAAYQVRKIAMRDLAWQLFKRVINPIHLFKAARLQWKRKSLRQGFVDAQLNLINKVLPTDFLHYGYFDDLEIPPEEMKLSDISRAQLRYAELLIDQMTNSADPVLDVGCGMGGISRLLRNRGYNPVALTPDRLQAAHIAATQPQVPVLRCKLERLPVAEHLQKYGTVLTSESLQYLRLDQALPIIEKILKPNGRWIASDYFQSHPQADDTCHNWEHFQTLLPRHGFRITRQLDISKNVIPMLSWVNMWSERIVKPAASMTTLRLQRKQPGVHYLFEGVIQYLNETLDNNLLRLDPTWFLRHRQYMMLTIERAA
ncbi:MAG: methyltransferase domain-containing protein [Tepidisphaeraceae bacterium]|jgi:MPBQ/MSBQ methyltransferase